MLMNVTVPGQDIMVKTALPVSLAMDCFYIENKRCVHSTLFFLALQPNFSHLSNQL